MTGSSARHVAYDLRPSKQTERMLVADILKLVSSAGLPIHGYPYLGLGGAVFYDFQMLFRYLGLKRMVSVEHSADMIKRCEFNKPFKFIEVFQGTTTDYIAQRGFAEPHLVWFDYDWRLSSKAVADIDALGASLPLDSIFFITLCAEPPKPFFEANMDAAKKVAWLQEELQGADSNCLPADVSNSKFRFYVQRVIRNAAKYAFAPRKPGRLIPLASVFYKDSAWMYTFGAAFVNETIAPQIRSAVSTHLPFLTAQAGYDIPDFNISQRERKLFDQICSGKRARKKAPLAIKNLGFSDEDVQNYRRLMRFIPQYTETFI